MSCRQQMQLSLPSSANARLLLQNVLACTEQRVLQDLALCVCVCVCVCVWMCVCMCVHVCVSVCRWMGCRIMLCCDILMCVYVHTFVLG